MPQPRLCLLILLVAANPAGAQVAEGPPQPPKLERPTTPPATPPANRPTIMDRAPTGMGGAGPVGVNPAAPVGINPMARQDPPAQPQQPRGAVAARVLARVNGQPILYEEVLNAAGLELEAIRPQVPEAQWPAVKQDALQRRLEDLIDAEVLIQDASNRVQVKILQQVQEAGAKDFDKRLKGFREKLKVNSDAELKKMMEERGYSFEEMRRQWGRTTVAMEYLRNLMKDKMDEIDRAEMLEYYRVNAKEFERPEMLTWQHLFIDARRFNSRLEARQQAEQLQQVVFAMKQREDFAALAQRYSHSPDRFQNGENVDPPGQIRPPEVMEALVRLIPGQTAPVIETEAGFHVVKLVAHQKAGQIPFMEACQDIKNKLQNKRWQAEMTRISKELRKKATIETGLATAKE